MNFLDPQEDNFANGGCNFLKLEKYLIIVHFDTDEFEITIDLDEADNVRTALRLRPDYQNHISGCNEPRNIKSLTI